MISVTTTIMSRTWATIWTWPMVRTRSITMVVTVKTSAIIAMLMIITVAWCIGVVVPVIPYKIHWAPAGIVSAAVFTPVFALAWWHMQIKWWVLSTPLLNNYRLWI